MGEAVDRAGNVWETDAQGKPVRFLRKMGPSGPPRDPTFDYKGLKAKADLGKTQAEIDAIRQQTIVDDRKVNLDERKFNYEVNQAARPKPGEKQMQEAVKAWAAANQVDAILPDIEAAFKAGPGATTGARGMRDFLWTPENQAFDKAANRLRAPFKSILGFTGGENNAVQESAVNVGPFIPSSWNFDKTNRSTFKAAREESAAARTRAALQMGGIPDSNGRITPVPEGYRMGQFPDLDKAIASRIDRVPMQKRQSFIRDAQKRYHALKNRDADSGLDPEVAGYLKQYAGQ